MGVKRASPATAGQSGPVSQTAGDAGPALSEEDREEVERVQGRERGKHCLNKGPEAPGRQIYQTW